MSVKLVSIVPQNTVKVTQHKQAMQWYLKIFQNKTSDIPTNEEFCKWRLHKAQLQSTTPMLFKTVFFTNFLNNEACQWYKFIGKIIPYYHLNL